MATEKAKARRMKLSKWLDDIFPLRHLRNVSMFYILCSVYNMWFMAGVWVFIWGRFMSNSQIGISDAITFAVGFAVELPSGVIADLMGRRKAIIFGNILLVLGNTLVGISSSFAGITIWYLVWNIGYAFQSGATEALTYDSVKNAGEEANWHKVIATSTVISKVTSLLATAIGGFMFGIWFRLPYLALGVVGIIGIIAAFRLIEVPIKVEGNLWSIKTYFRQIKDGVFTLFRRAVLPMSLISLTVASVAYMFNWGLLRPLTGERFGYTPVTFPVLLAAISLVGILATIILTRRQVKNVIPILFVSGFIYSILMIITGLSHKWLVGGLILMGLGVTHLYVDQLFSRYINLHTKAEHRATTLSAVALFTRAPYVILAILIGILAEKNSLPQFILVVGAITTGIAILSFVLYKLSPASHETTARKIT